MRKETASGTDVNVQPCPSLTDRRRNRPHSSDPPDIYGGVTPNWCNGVNLAVPFTLGINCEREEESWNDVQNRVSECCPYCGDGCDRCNEVYETREVIDGQYRSVVRSGSMNTQELNTTSLDSWNAQIVLDPVVICDIRFTGKTNTKANKHKSLKSQGYDKKRSTRWPTTPGIGGFKVRSAKSLFAAGLVSGDAQTILWHKRTDTAILHIYYSGALFVRQLPIGTYTRDQILSTVTDESNLFALFLGCSVIRDSITLIEREYVFRMEGRISGGGRTAKQKAARANARKAATVVEEKKEEVKEIKEVPPAVIKVERPKAIKGQGGNKKGLDVGRIYNKALREINEGIAREEAKAPEWPADTKTQSRLVQNYMSNMSDVLNKEGYRSRAIQNGNDIVYELVPITRSFTQDILPRYRTPAITDNNWLWLREVISKDPEAGFTAIKNSERGVVEFLNDDVIIFETKEELVEEPVPVLFRSPEGEDILFTFADPIEEEIAQRPGDFVDYEISPSGDVFVRDRLNEIPDSYKGWHIRSNDRGFFLSSSKNLAGIGRDRQPINLPRFTSNQLENILFADKIYVSGISDALFDALSQIPDHGFTSSELLQGFVNGGRMGNYTGKGWTNSPQIPVNRSDAISWLHDKLYPAGSKEFEDWTSQKFSETGEQMLSVIIAGGAVLAGSDPIISVTDDEGTFLFDDSGLPGGGKISTIYGEDGWEEDNESLRDSSIFLPKAFPHNDLRKMTTTNMSYYPGIISGTRIVTDPRLQRIVAGSFPGDFVEHYTHELMAESSYNGAFPRSVENVDGTYVSPQYQITVFRHGYMSATYTNAANRGATYEPVLLMPRAIMPLQAMTLNPKYQSLGAITQTGDIANITSANRNYMSSNLGTLLQFTTWMRDRNLALSDLKFDTTFMWLRILKYLAIHTPSGRGIGRGANFLSVANTDYVDNMHFLDMEAVGHIYEAGRYANDVEMLILNIDDFNANKALVLAQHPSFLNSTARTLFLQTSIGSGDILANYSALDYVLLIAGLMGTDHIMEYTYSFSTRANRWTQNIGGNVTGTAFDTSAIFVERYPPLKLLILTPTAPGQISGLRTGAFNAGLIPNTDLIVQNTGAVMAVTDVNQFLASYHDEMTWLSKLNAIHQLAQRLGVGKDLTRAHHFFAHNMSISPATSFIQYHNINTGAKANAWGADDPTQFYPLRTSAATLYDTPAGPSNSFRVDVADANNTFYFLDGEAKCTLSVPQESNMEFLLIAGICVAQAQTLPKPIPSTLDAWYDRLWSPTITTTLYATACDVLNLPETAANLRQENVQFPRLYQTMFEEEADGLSKMSKLVASYYNTITAIDAEDYQVTTFTWRPLQFSVLPVHAGSDISYDLNMAWVSPLHAYITCERLPLFAGIVTNPSKYHYSMPYIKEEGDFVRATTQDGRGILQTYVQSTNKRRLFKAWEADSKISVTICSVALANQGPARILDLVHESVGIAYATRALDIMVYPTFGRCATIDSDAVNQNVPFMLPVRNILTYNVRLQQYTAVALPAGIQTQIVGMPMSVISIRGACRGAVREDNGFQVLEDNDATFDAIMNQLLTPGQSGRVTDSLSIVKDNTMSNPPAPQPGSAAASGARDE